MTGRRGPAPTFDQAASPAYREIKRSIEEVATRTEVVFDRLEKRLDRMDKDVQRTEIGQDRLSAELSEIRRDVGELRDATHLAASKAVAAATTAAPVAAAAASSMTIAALPKTLWGRIIAAAVGFTTLMVALNNIPDAARGIDRFWAFIANKPPAVVHVRQDTKDGK